MEEKSKEAFASDKKSVSFLERIDNIIKDLREAKEFYKTNAYNSRLGELERVKFVFLLCLKEFKESFKYDMSLVNPTDDSIVMYHRGFINCKKRLSSVFYKNVKLFFGGE